METQPQTIPSSAALPPTRGYQQEMLEESLTNNLIIALDTGSGKTRIAVLRMKIEAERETKKVKHWVYNPYCRRYLYIMAGFLVLCTYCGIVRTAECSHISSSSGISWIDLRCP